MTDVDKNWHIFFMVFLYSVLIVAIVGMYSCVSRDWQFEDACRRAGGVLVSVPHDAATQMCVSNFNPNPTIIPVPDYRK